ncbi:AEC family transporter [Patulibacter sp. SYSU D01012]|uniref:AEC family transporter n=1 Tax=Patulibacter sp. SYSU D01012 TaxID=2817381 RepID=UPI001B304AA7
MSLPVLVVVMVAATLAGAAAQRRWHGGAEVASRGAMSLLLTWVLPVVYLVLVSRVHVDVTLLSGLAAGYVTMALCGTAAWFVAARVLRLPPPTVGAVILAVIVANTGYFGLPLVRTVLGGDELGPAVAWDSLVAGPMFFVAAFAVGAAFGTDRSAAAASGADAEERAELAAGDRLREFLRNPLLWAALAGLLLPWDAPRWAGEIAQDVVVAVLPVGFFVVGVQLAAQRGADGAAFRGGGLGAAVGLVVLLRLVAAPLVVVGLSLAFLDLPSGILLQAAAPSGLNGMLVSHRFGLDPRPVAASIVLTTTIMTLGVAIVTAVG